MCAIFIQSRFWDGVYFLMAGGACSSNVFYVNIIWRQGHLKNPKNWKKAVRCGREQPPHTAGYPPLFLLVTANVSMELYVTEVQCSDCDCFSG